MADPALQQEPGDRFDRFRRIDWWKQNRLRDAKVLVIGAGALGNEILKNLALLGVGNIFIADLDRIEESNLSRSVLFRPGDRGKSKAEVAAKAVASIYPDARIQWFHGNVIYGLGLGVFEWADVVIGGLDNREARLAINRACWKVNRPLIDGATEVLNGLVRVFVPPDGACYECTMSGADWELLKERRGCFGMQAAGLAPVTIPTTPITASVIAAIQCQEMVKLLHGAPSLAGSGMVFNGGINDVYTFRMNRNEDCNSHETFDRIVPLGRSASGVSAAELLRIAAADLGPGATVNFHRPLLVSLRCPACGLVEEVFRPVGAVKDDTALCPSCRALRQADTRLSLTGGEEFLDRAFSDLGVPPFDIIAAGKGGRVIGYQFSGDARAVLGPVWSSAAALAAAGVA
jgi:adenylyltransferase/sulfurtransferase